MKWKLVPYVLLLAGIILQAMPVRAATGTITVTGTVPLITYEVSASKITSHEATISWKTNGNATSQVFYDTKFHEDIDDYRYHTGEDTNLVSEHNITLTGLRSSTIYHYRVKSVAIIDGSEFVAVSEDYSFTTLRLKPPVVATLPAKHITSNSATLNGNLASLGTASVVRLSFEYWTDTGHVEETLTTVRNKKGKFSIAVSGLTPGATYHFRAKAVGDGTSYGSELSFTTTNPRGRWWKLLWWW